MTKYVRNPDGAVHSVLDEFDLPDDRWEELTEEDARKDNPSLFGAPDPQVAATELRGVAPEPSTDTPLYDQTVTEEGSPDA